MTENRSSSCRWNTTERAFSEALNSLVPKEGRLIVAFSGGCDSLALLVLCSNTVERARIVPVYVNHRLRPEQELEDEIALNRANCERLGLDLIVRTMDDGAVQNLSRLRRGGIEDAARALRYDLLEQERSRADASFILTAHHRDDQLETIIMRLSKGSPVSSLQGIRKTDPKRRIARPLLGFSRSELEGYLNEKGFRWSTDSTNSDASFSRNHVRNEVIPSIRAIWPEFEASILKLGEESSRLYGDLELQDLSQSVETKVFEGLDAASRTLVLYGMWDSLFPDRAMPLTLVDRVLSALSRGEDCNVGSNGALFTLYHGTLYLTDPSQDEVFSSFELRVKGTENNISLPGGLRFMSGDGAERMCADREHALALDPKLLGDDVVLRYVREGDRISLKDGSKMVLRLLQDMKIPSALRPRVPVLADKDGVFAVFAGAFGGRDRISSKFITSLARIEIPIYIVFKG